ncbi:hypothetical protein KIPB_016618, partial [Kipferlia bialata]|eukprot:g16618.t1
MYTLFFNDSTDKWGIVQKAGNDSYASWTTTEDDTPQYDTISSWTQPAKSEDMWGAYNK